MVIAYAIERTRYSLERSRCYRVIAAQPIETHVTVMAAQPGWSGQHSRMKLQSLLLENLVSNTDLFIENGIRGETCKLFISSDLMPEMHSQLPRPSSRHLSWLARHARLVPLTFSHPPFPSSSAGRNLSA